MTAFPRLVCTFLIVGCGGLQASAKTGEATWRQIKTLAEKGTAHGNPDLLAYMNSLTPEDVIVAARVGCAEGARNTRLTLQSERRVAGQSNALMCFEFYFEAVRGDDNRNDNLNTVIEKLVDMLDDKVESSCLRGAVLVRLSTSRNTLFADSLHKYVHAKLAHVTIVLNSIVKDRTGSALFRCDAIRALVWALGEEVSAIYRSDPNVREILKEKGKDTNNVVDVSGLVRCGEVSLTEETLRALNPFKEQIRQLVEILGTILADEKNEPGDLRKQARRTLEGYRKSALAGIDDEVEKALQRAAD